jgi:hypothetical protein
MQKPPFLRRVFNRCSGTVERRVLLPARMAKMLSRSRAHWSQATAEDYQALRQTSLHYIATNRRPEVGPGGYAYQAGGPPLLYASAYATLARHLCGDLDTVSASEKTAWVAFLQSFQCEDGLFRDPLLACDFAETCDWWGWRHLTLHVLMALTALNGLAPQRFALLAPYRSKAALESWLGNRDWMGDPANASNEVQNIGTLMQYARDFQGERQWSDSVNWLLDWLAAHQDPQTGLWGPRFDDPSRLSQGVQAGYHLWLLFLYDRRPVGHATRVVQSCLATQNRYGGFAPGSNSSACEDIDSIDPLARLVAVTPALRAHVLSSLGNAVPWALANANQDGGWVFKRHDPFAYGHPLMSTAADQSAMFPTWFRMLSLAFCAQALPQHPLARLPWRFLECPGHQFWRP